MMKITAFPFSTHFEESLRRNHRLHPYFVSKHVNAASKKNSFCTTSQKSTKWCSCLNLTSIPTKAEDLQVKVDEKSRTLTVSGKSETETTRQDGVKICSTHVWTKEIRIPDDVQPKTITSKLHENKLTFVAEHEEEEDKHQEIPIVIENAINVD